MQHISHKLHYDRVTFCYTFAVVATSLRLIQHLAYPVEHARPPLHSDALKHGQHGEQYIVKTGNSIIWSLNKRELLG